MNRMLIGGVLIVAVGLAGYAKGRADNEALHTAAELAEAKASADVMARLSVAEQEKRMLTQALEDQAYAQPSVAGCGMPIARSLRVRQYWPEP
jgi:hypothetical protein